VIFVDTGFFFALFSKKDPDHGRAAAAFLRFKGQELPRLFVTTNHVVMETITLAQASAGHGLAVEAGQILYAEKLARIHQATFDEERRAFGFLTRHRDKGYSSVDCVSFVVMQDLGIREAFAIDELFTHYFTAVPGPEREV
jgi:predicted nucleic acid-binding protein